MENLAKAIIQVMQAVKGIEKNTSVGSGNYGYKGVTDKDVKNEFNKAMSDAGLCILPVGIEDTTDLNRFESNGKPKLQVFTKVITKYLLLHTSGESQVLTGYGHGIDNGDKASGKATTYALKNCLLYTFLTPTGTIDDTETTHSDEIVLPPVKGNLTQPIAAAEVKAGKTLEQIKQLYHVTTEQEQKLIKLLK